MDSGSIFRTYSLSIIVAGNLARSFWAAGIAEPPIVDVSEDAQTIGTSIDAVEDATVIERPIHRGPDVTRRVGLFTNTPDQQKVRLYVYGFIKHVNFHCTGNWNGYVLVHRECQLGIDCGA